MRCCSHSLDAHDTAAGRKVPLGDAARITFQHLPPRPLLIAPESQIINALSDAQIHDC